MDWTPPGQAEATYHPHNSKMVGDRGAKKDQRRLDRQEWPRRWPQSPISIRFRQQSPRLTHTAFSLPEESSMNLFQLPINVPFLLPPVLLFLLILGLAISTT